MTRTILTLLLACLATTPGQAADLKALWDFEKPELSEQRFRAALETAQGDEALILQTQIARTFALRKDFERAREVLRALEPALEKAGAEVQTRYWLELGRTYASHRHSPESQTPESVQIARQAYTKALALARTAHLDGLAIDALHMFAFVDTAPEDQLKTGREALAVVEKSEDPDAKRWEASIRSNLGEALFDLGRYDEALEHFQRALVLRERDGSPRILRDAHWHVGRVLRALNRTEEALAIQLRLERESEAASEPRDYIYEELELLYRAKGDDSRASYYANRAKALAK